MGMRCENILATHQQIIKQASILLRGYIVYHIESNKRSNIMAIQITGTWAQKSVSIVCRELWSSIKEILMAPIGAFRRNIFINWENQSKFSHVFGLLDM